MNNDSLLNGSSKKRSDLLNPLLAEEIRKISAHAEHIGQMVAIQQNFVNQTAPLLQLQANMARWVSSYSVPRLLLAGEALRRLQMPYFSINTQFFRQIAFPGLELARQVLVDFSPTVQMVAHFQSQVALQTRLVSLWKSFEPLIKLAERIGKAEEVSEAFRAYNLWLAPSMPDELVQRIMSLHRQGANSGTVHSVISRYYARSGWVLLDRAVERWVNNPYMARRIDIFRQALKAHKQGLYGLTVPALLVHVEGIAADCVKSNKLMPKLNSKTKQILVSALQDTPCSLTDMTTYAAVTSLIFCIENNLYSSKAFDFDKDYERLLHEKKLSGHAIRHGRQVSYGSRMNSLIFFLILDVLSLLN